MNLLSLLCRHDEVILEVYGYGRHGWPAYGKIACKKCKRVRLGRAVVAVKKKNPFEA